MPRATWACRFRGCHYRRPANTATRRLLTLRDGGTPDGGVHSPLPEAENSAQHDGAAPPAEIQEALHNPAVESVQTPGAADSADFLKNREIDRIQHLLRIFREIPKHAECRQNPDDF